MDEKKNDIVDRIKGIVHPTMKILFITHPHVIHKSQN